MRRIDVFAPAKVNLALHVTGQRADGYHLLDSLVAFSPVGDGLTLSPAAALGLKVGGPEGAAVPEGPENLVLKAAALFGVGAAVVLEKCLPAVLVNPRVEVPTPSVFKALRCKDNPPLPEIPAFGDAGACIAWLARQRNDLQAPAVAQAPVIAEVLAVLAALPGCQLARMSGSGATCFGLFGSDAEAAAAQAALATSHPGWWSAHGALGDQAQKAAPQLR